MRDADICILRFRLAVIWNIENMTDMRNVEGRKWSVKSLWVRSAGKFRTYKSDKNFRSIADTYGAAATRNKNFLMIRHRILLHSLVVSHSFFKSYSLLDIT